MENQPFILVVEDDDSCADLLKYVLSREGFQVEIAPDGLAAQKRISLMTKVPDLVLLGVLLPFVDGFQLIQQIRRQDQWHDTPIIVLSANAQEPDIVRAFEQGAADYVAKPFQLGELVARIRRQINSRQQYA